MLRNQYLANYVLIIAFLFGPAFTVRAKAQAWNQADIVEGIFMVFEDIERSSGPQYY